MQELQQSVQRRDYRSPRREAAQLDTRRRIRAAAAERFLANGYPATSMRAIAAAANIADKTIYLHFSTKSALLKDVIDTAIVGDDDGVPAVRRQWFLDILEASAPHAKLELLADGAAALHERSGALFAMARGAAAVDADAQALWAAGKRRHRADMTVIARNFAAASMLSTERDMTWAVQTLYVLVGPETWHLVRGELACDEAGYHQWLLATLSRIFT